MRSGCSKSSGSFQDAKYGVLSENVQYFFLPVRRGWYPAFGIRLNSLDIASVLSMRKVINSQGKLNPFAVAQSVIRRGPVGPGSVFYRRNAFYLGRQASDLIW